MMKSTEVVELGDSIKTKWNWWGEVTRVGEIKSIHGIGVRRYNDNQFFSISYDDIIDHNSTNEKWVESLNL